MAAEADARKKVVQYLRQLDAHPVENITGVGTPDVECVAGWIELKYMREWPKRADTVVRFPKYTPQQRSWHKRRRSRGGNVWLLLKVGRMEWLIFDAAVAANLFDTLTRKQMEDIALMNWKKGLTAEDLKKIIQQGLPSTTAWSNEAIGLTQTGTA